MKRWQCDDSSYPNNTHYCWKPFGETVHYKLYTEHIRLWNAAILSDEATVEEPPRDLKAKLYLMKQEEEKGRKKVGGKEKDHHTSDITSMVPAAIAAAITSAVTSVNKTSADISTPPSISPTATLTQSDIVSSPKSTMIQTPSLANAQTEKTKTPLISAVHKPFFPPALPEVFEPMSTHTSGEIRTTPLSSANPSSTQFIPTSVHPMAHTFQNNSFLPYLSGAVIR